MSLAQPEAQAQAQAQTQMPADAAPTAAAAAGAAADTTTNANSTVEELYPIALLMDELRHDDVASRVQAMKRLDTIAIALGPERTRNELIPFLEDVIPEDEDEVIAVAAEELGNFVSFVGGSNYATILIPVLEKVSACEEPIVREKAIASLNKISQDLTPEQLKQSFIPLINRLAKERWFSLHIAATGLFKAVITKVPADDRHALMKLYLDLIHDDSPMVRKAAAKELSHLIDALTEQFKTPEELNWPIIVQMYESLVNDNQDSVKFLSVDVLISILKFVNDQGAHEQLDDLFTSLITLINDPSWRVRYMVADRFDSLAANFSSEQYTLKLVPHLISLMKDNEAEVRKAISKQLPNFAAIVNKFDNTIVLKELVPVVNQLAVDESENVRAALASKITNLAPILGKDLTIEYLLSIFVEMLKDEFSDVRLNIISNLQVVNDVIGIQLLSESLMPAITALANDKLWRVRLAIIQQIPLLAEQLGISFFDKTLGQLCMDWLWDPVYSIREAAVINLQKLSAFFGEEWCKEEVVDKILEKRESKDFDNFICRLTCLFTFDHLTYDGVVSPQLVKDYIYPFISELAADKVPNIRFNVAKALYNIAAALSKDANHQYQDIIIDEIKPALERLADDEDNDVRYFATENLAKVELL
jgi:serine/threonine-protein phosphatase 2A regulatory subunit A